MGRCRRFILLLLLIAAWQFLAYPCHAKSVGVIIGTSKYDHAGDLPTCYGDAVDAEKKLQKKGVINYAVHHRSHIGFRDPLLGYNSKDEIMETIEEAAAELKEGDTLVIFNSSHGNKGKGIVTSDGQYISTEELSACISKSKCSKVLFVNDSCYSGNLALNIPDKEVCQLNSSSPPMVSWTSKIQNAEHNFNSLFTKFFLEALDSQESDSNSDGNLTAGEIIDYIKRKVLFDETIKAQEAEELNEKLKDYPTTAAAKTAMDAAYKNYFAAKEKGDKEAMDKYAKDYFAAKYAYEVKEARIGKRWQSPTVIGGRDFVVLGTKEIIIAADPQNRCFRYCRCCMKNKSASGGTAAWGSIDACVKQYSDMEKQIYNRGLKEGKSQQEIEKQIEDMRAGCKGLLIKCAQKEAMQGVRNILRDANK